MRQYHIYEKANWLRGYMESLNCGDNVSKQQIELLSVKMEELLKSVRDYEMSLDYPDYSDFDLDEDYSEKVNVVCEYLFYLRKLLLEH